MKMETSNQSLALLNLLRIQLEEIDALVAYLTSICDSAEIEPDVEEWFRHSAARLDNAGSSPDRDAVRRGRLSRFPCVPICE
jgi:hypothetical protein